MKTKESDNTKKNKLEKEIREISKEHLTSQVFHYIKKITNKNNEILY